MVALRIVRAGPLATLQDAGRPGRLRFGVSMSGPMDAAAFVRAGGWVGGAGSAGIEFTMAGLSFLVEGGALGVGFDGGAFALRIDGAEKSWPSRAVVKPGSIVDITPGSAGNYGYLRFDREVDVPLVRDSCSTLAMPKSSTFTVKGTPAVRGSARKTFSGLRSRCTTPARCAAASA